MISNNAYVVTENVDEFLVSRGFKYRLSGSKKLSFVVEVSDNTKSYTLIFNVETRGVIISRVLQGSDFEQEFARLEMTIQDRTSKKAFISFMNRAFSLSKINPQKDNGDLFTKLTSPIVSPVVDSLLSKEFYKLVVIKSTLERYYTFSIPVNDTIILKVTVKKGNLVIERFDNGINVRFAHQDVKLSSETVNNLNMYNALVLFTTNKLLQ